MRTMQFEVDGWGLERERKTKKYMEKTSRERYEKGWFEERMHIIEQNGEKVSRR